MGALLDSCRVRLSAAESLFFYTCQLSIKSLLVGGGSYPLKLGRVRPVGLCQLYEVNLATSSSVCSRWRHALGDLELVAGWAKSKICVLTFHQTFSKTNVNFSDVSPWISLRMDSKWSGLFPILACILLIRFLNCFHMDNSESFPKNLPVFKSVCCLNGCYGIFFNRWSGMIVD